MVAQAVRNQSIRDRTRADFFNRGVVYSEFDIMRMRSQFEQEASPCPKCHMMVHPDNIEKHNKAHHPVIETINFPVSPVICTHTKFSVGQVVRIAGTSQELPIAEVKSFQGSSTVWYRFIVVTRKDDGGQIIHIHQWVEEGRLEAVTNLPAQVKRVEPVKVAEKQVSMLRGHTTLFPYGTFGISQG